VTSGRDGTFLLALMFLAAGFGFLFSAAAQTAAPRPHIVYIVSDDQGWRDVGFHGSDIKTPNLDRLAQEGARLEQFYAQPMCTPSRAALMTGRYPHRYGLQTAVIPSAGKYGLATDEWILSQALKEAGYRTAIVGKWHLGHADRKYWPRQRGFDYQYGPLLGEIDYFTHEAHGTRDWFRNNQPIKEQGYVTGLLGGDAVKLIEGHDLRTPLFLYLAFTAPHAPYQAPQEHLARYKHIADPNRRAYAAMVVFHSDNGGPRSSKFTGEVDTSKGMIPADNGPYRDGKGMLYEGGTRVGALANWPSRIKPGSVVDQPIHVVDMYPTLAAIAGALLTKNKPLDGMDVGPALMDGKPSPRDEVVYDIEPFRVAVRKGDWKLVWRTVLPSQVELFNLAQDPAEKVNLAEQNPQKVVELQQRAEALARDAVQPLLMTESLGIVWKVQTGSVSFPADDRALEMEP
jgi:arylsulfatase A-like enzyme